MPKLKSKGQNFREAKTIDWNSCKCVTTKGIEDYSQTLSSSNGNIQEIDMTGQENEII